VETGPQRVFESVSTGSERAGQTGLFMNAAR
jgi:hypothetical protein